MVCTTDPTYGRTNVYVNNIGFEIVTGSDVLENRYGVSEKFSALIFEGEESIVNGYDERFRLDPSCNGAVLDFVKVLDEGEWLERSTDPEIYLPIENNPRFRLTFMLGNFKLGVMINKDGYATVDGINAYLKFDEEKAEPLFDLLASGSNAEALPHEDSTYRIRPEAIASVPLLGEYAPKSAPEGYRIEYVFVKRYVNEFTGKIGDPKAIIIDYRAIDNEDVYLSLSIYTIDELKDIQGVRHHSVIILFLRPDCQFLQVLRNLDPGLTVLLRQLPDGPLSFFLRYLHC
jgi:hypothetical protein